MSRNYLRVNIFIFLSGICGLTVSQKINTQQMLLAALQHESIKTMTKSMDDMYRLRYHLPFVEKIEFRTETDRLLTSRQEFLARTSFNGFSQKKAENDKFNKFATWKSGKTYELRNELLSERYFDIIEVLFQNEKLAISREMLSHFVKKEKIYESMMVSGLSADLDDYIKIKISILEETAKIENSIHEIENGLKKMDLDKFVPFDTADFIAIEEAALLISKLDSDFEQHAFLKDFEAERDYLQAALEAENAEAGKIIDFAQVKYTVRDDLLLQNRFSVGIGLLIPWRGSNGLKQSEFKAKQNLILSEREVKKRALQIDAENLKNTFNQKYQQYNSFLGIVNNSDTKKLKEQVIASGRLDPVKVVELEKSDIEMSLKLCTLKFELLELYIEILISSGDLFSYPYKNYLNALFPLIAE